MNYNLNFIYNYKHIPILKNHLYYVYIILPLTSLYHTGKFPTFSKYKKAFQYASFHYNEIM